MYIAPLDLEVLSSGTGIQAKNKTSGVSFSNTPYITRLISNFKKRLLEFG